MPPEIPEKHIGGENYKEETLTKEEILDFMD